ncbi:MAG: flagellar protein [Acetivibrionales bacterium]|jgi:hypothetical protein
MLKLRRINCSICGKLSEAYGFSSTCPDCFQKDMQTFDRIRQYLYENPHAHMFEVATNLQITISTIKRYLREGRLEIVEENNLFLRCIICGESIKAGYYCESCLTKSNHDYKSYFTGNANRKIKSEINYLTGSRK